MSRACHAQTIHAVLPLGGHETIRDLAAFREHNVVPIRAFYEGEVKTNYFARLVSDSNHRVRAEFYRVMADWLTNLAERFDYSKGDGSVCDCPPFSLRVFASLSPVPAFSLFR